MRRRGCRRGRAGLRQQQQVGRQAQELLEGGGGCEAPGEAWEVQHQHCLDSAVKARRGRAGQGRAAQVDCITGGWRVGVSGPTWDGSLSQSAAARTDS
jgi:hypothetical protein